MAKTKTKPFDIHNYGDDESSIVLTKKYTRNQKITHGDNNYVIVHGMTCEDIDTLNQIHVYLTPMSQMKKRRETIKTFFQLIFNSEKNND